MLTTSWFIAAHTLLKSRARTSPPITDIRAGMKALDTLLAHLNRRKTENPEHLIVFRVGEWMYLITTLLMLPRLEMNYGLASCRSGWSYSAVSPRRSGKRELRFMFLHFQPSAKHKPFPVKRLRTPSSQNNISFSALYEEFKGRHTPHASVARNRRGVVPLRDRCDIVITGMMDVRQVNTV